jgi:hypothetical protein
MPGVRQVEPSLVACLALLVAGCSGCGLRGPHLGSPEEIKASGSNMGLILRAAAEYEAANEGFPIRTLRTTDGQPGLSWRVAILPYLGEEELYNQFRLNEPWDSAHNRPLADKMPAVYKSPTGRVPAGHTNYLAVAGPDSVLMEDQSRRLTSIVDGTANTALLVEVNNDRAVPWTRPDDFAWTPEKPSDGLGGLYPKGAFLVGYASGDVGLVSNVDITIDAASIAALYTCSFRSEQKEKPTWWPTK